MKLTLNLAPTLFLLLILAANLALSGCRSAHTESPLLENQLVSIRRSSDQPPHQIHAVDGNIGVKSRGDDLKLEIYRSARKAGGRRSGSGYGAAGLRRPPHKSKSPASPLTTTPPLFVLAATVILLFFFLHFPSHI